MSKVINEKMAAEIEGDFVVFLIGMRVNNILNIRQWFPVFIAMPKMLKELEQHPDMGLLGYRIHFGFPNILVLQYWRSFEHLTAYATNREAEHVPTWAAFYKRISSSKAVGIWHETYCVGAGQYEAIYYNMPAYGLGKVGALVPASGHRATAAGRVKVNAE
jgi:hypothetical protein